MNIFWRDLEEEAISRIVRFAKIAKVMDFPICVGFSGGKDSQVVYDLMLRSGVEFKAYFNRSFESNTTIQFIKIYYPDVIFRREYKYGFIENIHKKHGGMLPSVYAAYCCQDYKHNPLYIDKCSVIGVRRAESRGRQKRTSISLKNKTSMKKHKTLVSEYFTENCQSIGSASEIQLMPIVDWLDSDVWEYIHRHKLPINPEYKDSKRVGCIVCPKANFSSNGKALLRMPKLIDAFILAREKGSGNIEWIITGDNIDYSDNKVEYICRWLNHSFMPFSKKQKELFEKVKDRYLATKKINTI